MVSLASLNPKWVKCLLITEHPTRRRNFGAGMMDISSGTRKFITRGQ